MQLQANEQIKRLLFVAGLAGMALFVGHELELHLAALEAWVQGLGAFAPLGFIALFVVLSPVFVSVDALCLAAGLLFPIGRAEIYVIISTYLAAAVIFYLGRHLLRDRVAAFIARHKSLAALDAKLGSDAFKLMLLLRLTPLPFAPLSYALSVTRVGFWPYLGATSGILIYNASLVYLGYATKQVAGLISGPTHQDNVSYPLLVLGLSVTVLILGYIAKTASETLKRLDKEKSDY